MRSLALLALACLACQTDQSSWTHTRGVFEPGVDHATLDTGLEYRTPSSSAPLQAVLGGSLLDESDCQGHCGNYFYTGLRYPFFEDLPIDAGVGLSVGAYHAGEVPLGSIIVLRPGVDVNLALGSGVTFGGYVHHFTSGPWGDENPGAEAVGLSLGWRF